MTAARPQPALHNAANALAEARRLLAQIEQAMPPPGSAEAHRGMQAIDLLDQQLGDLVTWLHGLAEGISPQKLKEGLTLGVLRQRLCPDLNASGSDGAAAQPNSSAPASHIELF